MRHSSFVLLAALLAPTAAAAQTGPQPTLVLTIFAGVVTGHSLWRVNGQPYEVRGAAPTFAPSGLYDTLNISRTVGSSLAGGMSATMFPSSNFGFQAEVAYLGLPLENGCVGTFYNSDAEQKNQQLCNNVSATSVSGSALGVFLGVLFRGAPRGSLSPYLRAGGGLTFISRSTIAMEGEFVSGGGTYSKAIVVDPKPRETSPSLLFGVGLTTTLGPGYQFRLEVRDVLASQTRLDAPVNGLGIGPSSTKMYHHVGLTMGLDVVLERKRGRRY